MPHYFYVIPAGRFVTDVQPALAAAWRSSSFQPCRELCRNLAAAADGFAITHRIDPNQLFISHVFEGLPFSKDAWRSLAGDLLMVCASMIPEIQTAPRTLTCLLSGKVIDGLQGRSQLTPIEQVHYGSLDLAFGSGFYRPEHAGLNEQADVARLADYLVGVDSTCWTKEQLSALNEIEPDDREEELDFARQCLRQLTDVYRSAQRHVIVCEVI